MNTPRRGAEAPTGSTTGAPTLDTSSDDNDDLQQVDENDIADLRSEMAREDDERLNPTASERDELMNTSHPGKWVSDRIPVRRPSFATTSEQTSKAPRGRHFTRLEELMSEALDQNDDFSRAQAVAILQSMTKMLGVDVEL